MRVYYAEGPIYGAWMIFGTVHISLSLKFRLVDTCLDNIRVFEQQSKHSVCIKANIAVLANLLYIQRHE